MLSTTLKIISKSEEVIFLVFSLPFIYFPDSCLNITGTLFDLKYVLEKALNELSEVSIFPSSSSRPTFLSMGL
jgi:hypothetical protein